MSQHTTVRVALDAMGGDFAPSETVKAATQAAHENLQIILFGDPSRLEAELSQLPHNPSVSIVATSQEVSMHDHPAEAFRKKPDSSLRRATEAIRAGQADATISAGNTGAAMAAALFCLGRIQGVDRPGIACTIPTATGKLILLDAGANVDCSSIHLSQFALMGSIFAIAAWGIQQPTVGILNIGEETSKGNALTRQTHELLNSSPLHYIGNVEPKEALAGKVDVVVCDGFVGNIFLKTSEAMAELIGDALKKLAPEIGPDTIKETLTRLRSKMDYAVYGGAPLLGVNGVSIIAHGRSHAPALVNALKVAEQCVRSRVVQQIQEHIQEIHL